MDSPSISVLILSVLYLSGMSGSRGAPGPGPGPVPSSSSSEEPYSSEEMVVPRHPKISGNKIQGIHLSLNEKASDLVCEIQGTPTPKAIWLKNSKELPKEFETSYSSKGGISTLTLEFDDIQVKEVDGNYTCVAANFLGKASRTFIITITTDMNSTHPTPLLPDL